MYPRHLDTNTLGRLRFVELEYLPGDFLYTYEPLAEVDVHGQKVKVIVKPPPSGIENESAFVAEIDRAWTSIAENLNGLCEEAVPHINTAIECFCVPDDEYTPPDARTLLSSSQLNFVKIDLTGGDEFDTEIGFHDTADLVGGHDLYIILDPDFQPIGARFDG